jgi:hypothetical protein
VLLVEAGILRERTGRRRYGVFVAPRPKCSPSSEALRTTKKASGKWDL